MSWRAYLEGHPFDLDLLVEHLTAGIVRATIVART